MCCQTSKPNMDPRGKYWCWTYNKHPEHGYEPVMPNTLDDYKTQRGQVSITYTCGQEEKAPTTGQLHIQGYVEFDNEVRFSWLRATFNGRIHWEKRKGTAKQASDYSKKDDTAVAGGIRWELGELSQNEQGKRNDLATVADKVLAGATLKRLAEEHPVEVIKFAKGIQTLIDLTHGVPDDCPKKVIILYGQPGTGKSSWARRFLSEQESFYCPAMNNAGALSFESYADQQWLWLDDFASNALTAQALKCLCDRYPTQLPGRGSSKWARHVGVVITSNYPIETWFKEPVEAAAIRRRCAEIWITERDFWRWDGGSVKSPAQKPNPMREFIH